MHWNWNDGWNGWNWALMTIGMFAFWALMVWVVVAFVRSPSRTGNRRNDSAEEMLAERLASGEIDGKEYQHRLDLLRSGNAHPASKASRNSLPRVPGRPSDKSNT
jgi:putative membrane protein